MFIEKSGTLLPFSNEDTMDLHIGKTVVLMYCTAVWCSISSLFGEKFNTMDKKSV